MGCDSGETPRSLPRTALSEAGTDLLLLFVLFVVGVTIVNPLGDFPLNDDWSFGLTVKRFVETGEYFPTGWAAMTLLTNVLWGALFCLADGFSFTALRLSTLAISFLGLCASYFLVREVRQRRWIAVLAALTVAFHPIYFALSHSFMTDVPFTSLSTLSGLFFVRHLKTGNRRAFILGTLLSVAATLSRQLGLFIPLAFALTLLLKEGVSTRSLCIAFAPLAMCIMLMLGFTHWLDTLGRLPELYKQQDSHLLGALGDFKSFAIQIMKNAYRAIAYTGLFLMPLLAISLERIVAMGRRRAMVLLGGFVLAMTCGDVFASYHGTSVMPLMHNVLIKSGIGPLTLPDVLQPDFDHVPALPMQFWWGVTAMALVGGAMLLTVLSCVVIELFSGIVSRQHLSGMQLGRVFLIVCVTIYILPVMLTKPYDRYLLPVTPFLAAAVLGFNRKRVAEVPIGLCRSAGPAIVLVAAFGFFAVCTTRDYLAWNRVRWEALRQLIDEDHVSPASIDGGLEFNGLYFYDPATVINFGKDARGKSWWWVQDDEYKIAFGSVPGYRITREYKYRHWLPWHMQRVVTLRKE